MPAPRKIDLLPPELREWLGEGLRARGFADYEGLAAELNDRLEAAGMDLRIGKSAIHAWGQDVRDYARKQGEIQDQIKALFGELGMADEAKVTSVLFQQQVALVFRLQMALAQAEETLTPKEARDLTTALTGLLRASGMRAAIRREMEAEQKAKLDTAVAAGDIDAEAAAKARRIMGFAA